MLDNVITLDDSPLSAVIKMSEGSPGAVTVMLQLLENSKDLGLITIMKMDDMQIRGWKIWVGYKDYCKMDIQKFSDLIISRDQDIQKFIHDYK